jgi:hypothetical protein
MGCASTWRCVRPCLLTSRLHIGCSRRWCSLCGLACSRSTLCQLLLLLLLVRSARCSGQPRCRCRMQMACCRARVCSHCSRLQRKPAGPRGRAGTRQLHGASARATPFQQPQRLWPPSPPPRSPAAPPGPRSLRALRLTLVATAAASAIDQHLPMRPTQDPQASGASAQDPQASRAFQRIAPAAAPPCCCCFDRPATRLRLCHPRRLTAPTHAAASDSCRGTCHAAQQSALLPAPARTGSSGAKAASTADLQTSSQRAAEPLSCWPEACS